MLRFKRKQQHNVYKNNLKATELTTQKLKFPIAIATSINKKINLQFPSLDRESSDSNNDSDSVLALASDMQPYSSSSPTSKVDSCSCSCSHSHSCSCSHSHLNSNLSGSFLKTKTKTNEKEKFKSKKRNPLFIVTGGKLVNPSNDSFVNSPKAEGQKKKKLVTKSQLTTRTANTSPPQELTSSVEKRGHERFQGFFEQLQRFSMREPNPEFRLAARLRVAVDAWHCTRTCMIHCLSGVIHGTGSKLVLVGCCVRSRFLLQPRFASFSQVLPFKAFPEFAAYFENLERELARASEESLKSIVRENSCELHGNSATAMELVLSNANSFLQLVSCELVHAVLRPVDFNFFKCNLDILENILFFANQGFACDREGLLKLGGYMVMNIGQVERCKSNLIGAVEAGVEAFRLRAAREVLDMHSPSVENFMQGNVGFTSGLDLELFAGRCAELEQTTRSFDECVVHNLAAVTQLVGLLLRRNRDFDFLASFLINKAVFEYHQRIDGSRVRELRFEAAHRRMAFVRLDGFACDRVRLRRELFSLPTGVLPFGHSFGDESSWEGYEVEAPSTAEMRLYEDWTERSELHNAEEFDFGNQFNTMIERMVNEDAN